MPGLLYFKKAEFECPCCGEEHMAEEFLARLDNARAIAGVPFSISSGWRCKKHNRDVGGVAGSEHISGHGVDITASSSALRFKIVKACLTVGFTRIGISRSFVHVGDSDSHPQGVMWLY